MKMKILLTDTERKFVIDTLLFYMKENYKETTIWDTFVSLTAEHKQILKYKYPDIVKESCNGKG